jgi:hypothetical protein
MNAIDERELDRASARRLSPGVRNAGGLLISLGAIGAVVWWALRQKAPTFPSGAGVIMILVASIGCYVVATVVRGLRWHLILGLAGPVGALWTTAGAAYGHAGGAETSPLRTTQGALGVRTNASTALGNTGPSHRIRG